MPAAGRLTARAARLKARGEPLVVEEVELADPRPGEAVVELAYAGVNPVDGYHASGALAADIPLPRTLGSEGAGTVGDRRVVAASAGLGSTRPGTFASRAVVPEAALVDVPEGVDLRQAACVAIAGRTAWRCTVDLAEVGPGDRVLVLGAAGGVGVVAVSLAASRGAEVVAQTADRSKASFLESRGAEVLQAASPAELAGSARLAMLAPTVVLDALGGGFTGAAVELAAAGGRIVLYGTSAAQTGELPLRQLYRKGLRLLGYAGITDAAAAVRAASAAVLGALAAGRLEIPVEEVLPLEEVNEALSRLARRSVRGKLVLATS